MPPGNSTFLIRLQRLGLLSLAALFLGGIILILTGINGLIRLNTAKGEPINDGIRVFYYGSQLSVQSWIAILGVSFGLLSYGLNETYAHFFDWWCSRRAQRNSGLDYGLYLNSQPRAPVLYSRRGFIRFITLRYFLTLASIATSIGYKFGIVKAELAFLGALDQKDIALQTPVFSVPVFSVTNVAVDNPWLTDNAYRDRGNIAFYHDYDYWEWDSSEPPRGIVMTGIMNCSTNRFLSVNGDLVTREVVLVANMTEDEGLFSIANNTNGWRRTTSSGFAWFDSSQPESRAVVDYHMPRADKVQIQWAKLAPWLDSSYEEKLPVVRRITYTIHYAVAEVRRTVTHQICYQDTTAEYKAVQILSNDDTPANASYNIPNSQQFGWADAMISTWGDDPRNGVSSIVRVAMTIFANASDNSPIRFVPTGTHPFGPEDTPYSFFKYGEQVQYPFIKLQGWTATGNWIAAAGAFLVIGCFAVIVGVIRICVGPPVLTSWMAQHVFLAQSGAISFSISQEGLATGYKAASIGLGTLHLRKENGS
jgi:hypothetical protein